MAPQAADQDQGPEGAPEEVSQLLGTLPADAQVDLCRWNETGHRPGFKMVRTFAAADFSEGMVARKYGGGDYRIYVRFKKDGKATVERRDFGIDASVRPEGDPVPLSPAPASVPGQPSPSMERASWEILSLQIEALKSLITSIPRESPAELFKAAVELVKANQPAAPAVPPKDPIELAMQLHQLTKGNGREGLGLGELLEAVPRILELAGELRGTGDGGTASALVSIAGTIERLATAQPEPAQLTPGARPRPPLALVPRAPAPAPVDGSAPPAPPAPAPAAAAAEPTPVAPPWYPYFARFLPLLMEAAASDSDPALYADLLLDRLPREADPLVNELLADPDYPSNILRELPPETASAHQWLARMLEAVRVELTEPEPAPGGE